MKSIIHILLMILLAAHSGWSQTWNINLDITDITCKGANDGVINLMVNGSDRVEDSLYRWEWLDAGGNVFDTINDPVRFLPPGEFAVRVTRLADHSVLSAQATIEESDSAMSVTQLVVQENFCAGDAAGIIQASASGGSGAYVYGLGMGEDAELPDYTGGYADNGGLFQSLSSGTYTVWARDSRGCKAKSSAVTITEPQSISVGYEITNANCEDQGGQLTVKSIAGGIPYEANQAGSFNFQLEWKDISNDSVMAINEASVTGLSSGTYQLSIRDKNECVQTLRLDVERGFLFEVMEVRNISCNQAKNGRVKVALKANNPVTQEPFALMVKDGNGNELTTLAKSNVQSGEVTLSQLGPGQYTIEARDAMGCVKEQQVAINQPDELQLADVMVTDVKCKGTATGEIFFSVHGGSGSYMYSIDSGASYVSNPRFTDLPVGTYSLFVRDDGGCRLHAGDVTITEPPTGFAVEEVAVSNVLCNGRNNGAIEIFFSDSTGPNHLNESEDIVWMNEEGELMQRGSQSLTNLREGIYQVRITDDYGCVFHEKVKVESKYELRADFSMRTNRFCVDYPITFTDKSLGEGIVSWLWDFGDGTGSTDQNPVTTFSEEGTYFIDLTIENEVGCNVSKRDTLQIQKGYHITVPTAFSPNGDRLNDTFRPEFDNISRLKMRVINVQGITMYESDKLSAAWNGSFRGEEAPQGPYYYEIEYATGSGVVRKERGKVFLLR